MHFLMIQRKAEQARENMLARYSIDSTVNRLLELGKGYRYIYWG